MEKQENPSIVAVLKTTTPSHAVQTIDKYKQAIKAFDSKKAPVRVKLYELYEDLLLDGQVEATFGKRRDNILNRRLSFVRGGMEDEQITKLLNSPDMRNLLEELHNTVGFGYTLIYVDKIWFDKEQEYYRVNFELIPRAHTHPEVEFECISIDANKVIPDILYKNPPLSNYMIWAGKPKDKGLFVKVAPYVIYKRGAMGDWSQFSEMFGMPFREAIYDAFDNETREKLDELLQNWGPGTSLTHPKSVEIKIHETNGSADSSDVYDRFIQVCDAAISKTILGNTLTTEQGETGARSLGEVHQNAEDNKKLSDEQFVLSILNTQFRGILKRFGFNVTGGEIWYETPDTDWERLQKKWNVVSGIAEKVPVGDDYIYEEFDIPKPENYEELKEEMRLEKLAGLMPFGNVGNGVGAEYLPPEKPQAKNHFWGRLFNFFGLGRTVKRPEKVI